MSDKRKFNRKLITIKCDYCGKEFQKPLSEYERNQKKGRKSYCSRECVGKGVHQTKKELPHSPASDKMKKHLKKIQGNRRDEYSSYRYTYRCIKRRFNKETNLTLQDLKEQWEKQNGVCPYTGLNLILPEDNNIHLIDFFHRASLDRIDSSKGYVKGNIQFISTPINLMKSDKSENSIKRFLKEISEYTSKLM